MRQVVGLEVAGIDAQPLAAQNIVRTQQLGSLGILDDATDLASGEVGNGVVGSLLEQQVSVRSQEWQPAPCPSLFVLLFALFGAGLKRWLHVEGKVEARRAGAGFCPEGWVIGLDRLPIFRRQLLVPGRYGIGGSPLEDCEG